MICDDDEGVRVMLMVMGKGIRVVMIVMMVLLMLVVKGVSVVMTVMMVLLMLVQSR